MPVESGEPRVPVAPIERFHRAAARNPLAIAIGGPSPMTYREVVAAVDALACGLQALDPAPGSRVGICAKNTVEHLLALLAAYRAGKVWVPLNPRNGKSVLDAMIAATSPSLLVADASCLDRFTPTSAPLVLGRTAPDAPHAQPAPSVRSLVRDFAGHVPAAVARSAEDAQVIKFSGGSTGTPKAVVQPLRCIGAQADGILQVFEFRDDDVNLIAAPLTHGASCFVLPILEAGGRHVLLEDPNPDAILATIAREGVTTIYAPPTMLYGMLGAVRAGQRFPTLRHVIYSAAPMSPERIRECQRVFGPVIETAYGQVEAPQIVTAMRAHELLLEENLGSVGRPSPVARIRVDDDGEILVSGPLLMSEYLGQPAMTRDVLQGGWLRTGDTGTIDARGYLHIRGRIRETINTGGFKVHPGDVEAVLARHAAVRECAVFGVPDERWGEAVTAAVVRASQHGADAGADRAALATMLTAFVKAELGSVMAPKSVHFLDELPRNAAGKVSRADVRRLLDTTPGTA